MNNFNIPCYRTKPIQIEAILFNGHNHLIIKKWSNGKVMISPILEPTNENPSGNYLQIKTSGGISIAIVGDYIIKGIDNEFYTCKPDLFEKTYESVYLNKFDISYI